MKYTDNKIMMTLLVAVGVLSSVPAAFAAPAFPVPEAVSTVGILGLALLGIEVARRKLKK